MYTYFKKYRLIINIFLVIVAFVLFVLKLEDVLKSYSLSGIVLIIGALFNGLLTNESAKRKSQKYFNRRLN